MSAKWRHIIPNRSWKLEKSPKELEGQCELLVCRFAYRIFFLMFYLNSEVNYTPVHNILEFDKVLKLVASLVAQWLIENIGKISKFRRNIKPSAQSLVRRFRYQSFLIFPNFSRLLNFTQDVLNRIVCRKKCLLIILSSLFLNSIL